MKDEMIKLFAEEFEKIKAETNKKNGRVKVNFSDASEAC